MISMLTSTARLLRSTLESIATPSWVDLCLSRAARFLVSELDSLCFKGISDRTVRTFFPVEVASTGVLVWEAARYLHPRNEVCRQVNVQVRKSCMLARVNVLPQLRELCELSEGDLFQGLRRKMSHGGVVVPAEHLGSGT